MSDENPPPMRGRGRASRHRLAKVPEMLPMDPRPLPSTSGSTTSGSSDRSSSYQPRGAGRGDPSRPSVGGYGRAQEVNNPDYGRISRGARGRSTISRPTRGIIQQSSGTSQSKTSSSAGTSLSSHGSGEKSSSSEHSRKIQAERTDLQKKRDELTDVQKELAPRPGHGTIGHAVEVKTNSYEIKNRQQNRVELFQYEFRSLDFDELIKPNVNEAFEFFRLYNETKGEEIKGIFWYDGRNKVYSNVKIDEGRTTVKVNRREYRGNEEFFVDLRLTKQFDHLAVSNCWDYIANAGDHIGERPSIEIITALDCLIKHNPSIHTTRVGSNFFPSASHPHDLGNGKCAISGFSLSMRACEKANIQVKSKHGAFFKAQPLGDLLNETFFPPQRGYGGDRGGRGGGNRGGAGRDNNQNSVYDRLFITNQTKRRVKEICKGLQINIHYRPGESGKTRKIKDISDTGANHMRFEIDGQVWNVQDYFAQKKEIFLRYPGALCVNTKSRTNPEWYPLELCHIVANQPVKGALGEEEVSNMIRLAAKPADETMKSNVEAFRAAKGDLRDQLNKVGLDVEDKAMTVPARILPTPRLMYSNDMEFECRDGQWRPKKFRRIPNQGKGLINFEVVFFGQIRGNMGRDIENFVGQLQRTGQQLGFPVAQGKFNSPECDARSDENICKHLKQLKDHHDRNQQRLDVILCFMPRKDSRLYSSIKFFAERKLGILTQCVTMKSVSRANEQLCGMVLMKLCAKIGGACAEIDHSEWSAIVDTKISSKPIFEVPTMIVGISINSTARALTGSNRACSVGLSFSVDRAAAQYLMICGKSVDGKTVDNLDQMMMEALKNYRKKQRTSGLSEELSKPQVIIVYRTGTSDGEKGIITALETTKIKKAFANLDKNYKPLLTYITVDKSHNQRFASQNSRLQIGKSKNVPAGLVVDKHVVGLDGRFDFYLTSSQGIQGTSIPAYYCVCLDELNLTADSVQSLSYHLCYGYTRCTRVVSMPNCVMYAKLAAERGRIWLNKALYDGMEDFSSEEGSHAPDEQENRLIDDVLNINVLCDNTRSKNSLAGAFFYC